MKIRSSTLIPSPSSGGRRRRRIRQTSRSGNRSAGFSLPRGAAVPGSDRTSGSAAISDVEARALARVIAEPGLPDVESLERKLLAVGQRFLDAYPSMALVFAIANAPLVAAATARRVGLPMTRARRDARRALTATVRRRGRAARRASERAARLLAGARRIATLSRSGVVTQTLLRLAGPRAPEIWIAESRPALEGRIAARSLRQAGFAVTVFPDALLAAAAGAADAVLVGADRLGESAFVNKAGTLALALGARFAGRPMIVAAESLKRLPSAVPLVLPDGARRPGRPWQPIFERVPYGEETVLVTEAARGTGAVMRRLHGGLIRALAARANPSHRPRA